MRTASYTHRTIKSNKHSWQIKRQKKFEDQTWVDKSFKWSLLLVNTIDSIESLLSNSKYMVKYSSNVVKDKYKFKKKEDQNWLF